MATRQVVSEVEQGYLLTKPSCKHCYGRGYVGFNRQEGFIPCKCIVFMPKKEKEKCQTLQTAQA
jgi:hypothetical protein